MATHRSTLLCSNVVKFVRRDIGEIVRYLPDKKISASSQTVASERIAPKTGFRCDPLRSDSLRGSRNFVFFYGSVFVFFVFLFFWDTVYINTAS